MSYTKSHTLCWECQRALCIPGHSCSWAVDKKPVEGWTAIKTIINTPNYYKRGYVNKEIESYTVIECPLFTPGKAALGKYTKGAI